MGKVKNKLTEAYHNGHTEPCESDFMTDEEIENAMQQTQDDHHQAMIDRVVQEGIDRRKGK